MHGLQSVLTYIPFLIFALIFYSHAVYPKISTAWGGGNKAAVLLYPTARGMDVCKTLALPIQKNQFAVGPLKVLTETEKEVVVLVPDGITNKEIAIRLNRELIEAIQSLSS